MLNFLVRIGKALMLPIAALPAAALLLRIGQPDLLGGVAGFETIGPVISAAGDALFANLPLLFAIGVAIGFAKDSNGAAGLSGAIGYLVLDFSTKAYWGKAFGESAGSIKMMAFGGILAGIIAGLTYNRYHQTKLPEWLGFFSGRRLVPIVTSFIMLGIGIALMFIWPPIQDLIEAVGEGIVGLGAVGAGLFGLFNRLLIPLGLHHVLNNYFFFNLGEFDGKFGDLNRFFAGDPTAGHFMAGFFPVMMFGLPAVALAIYFAAKKQHRKAVGGMLISIAVTSFLTGITEPIEFLFIFLSPVLLVIHAILTGLSMFLASTFTLLHGFGFSAGLFDYILNFNKAHNPIGLLALGLVIGVLYFFIFSFAIRKFNIPTPGREDDFVMDEDSTNTSFAAGEQGEAFVIALGGKENIAEIDHCATRLRLTVLDSAIIDEGKLRSLGARGVVKLNKTTVQVIIGTNVQFVFEDIKGAL
ncbi:MAG: N-acetylglucosamine-specific PTS transporter subunit IIBC [Bacilli bacterium]